MGLAYPGRMIHGSRMALTIAQKLIFEMLCLQPPDGAWKWWKKGQTKKFGHVAERYNLTVTPELK